MIETTANEEVLDNPVDAGSAAEEEEAPPSVFDWNGEVEALSKADWFSRIDEPTRNTLVRGVESKYKNFERGFTKAFQDTASRRRDLERREAALRDQEQKIQKWLTGDADPMAEKQAEIDRLKTMHDTALETLRSEYEQSVRKAQEEWTGKYGSAERERDDLKNRLEQFEYQVKQAEERQVEEAVDEVENWLKEEASDIYGNDDAFYAFCVLCTGGIDPEDAVSMVRVKYGAPPPPEPEPVPAAMDLMSMGPSRAASTAQSDNRSYKEIMDSMRRMAQSDEAQFYTPKR
jgi:hypothetical protein